MSHDFQTTGDQSLMAAVNAQIDRLHRSFGLPESDFFCECGDAACRERITIGRAEFAELRNRSGSVVAPAHGYRVGRESDLVGAAQTIRGACEVE